MLSGKNITETAIAIFFAFIPMMFLMGFAWFILIMDTEQASDYLAEYQETVVRQENKIGGLQEEIKELQDFSHPNLIFKSEVEQDNWIEILRTQVNQLKPTN